MSVVNKIGDVLEHALYTINGLTFHLDTIFSMWLCMAFIIIMALFMTRNISLNPAAPQFVGEKIVGVFLNLTKSMMGEEGEKHVPLLASLFLFIVTANLSGQIPWKLYHLSHGEIASPTNDINMTAAMAVIVLIYYLYFGFKKKGLKYP